MNEVLKRLCKSYGPPANTKAVAAIIEKEISPFVDEICIDKLGNLIAHKKGLGKKVWIGAAMDQPCMIVTYAPDNGRLKFSVEGILDLRPLSESEVVFEDGSVGTLLPEHESAGGESRDYYIRLSDGGRAGIGDVAVLKGSYSENGALLSSALHQRAGCSCLIDVIKSIPAEAPGNFCFAFTSHSVAEARGAKTASFDFRPDIAVSIGTSPADHRIHPGFGPVLHMRDPASVTHPDLVAAFENAASRIHIQLQREVASHGFSLISGVVKNGFNLKTASVCLPVAGYQTPDEAADSGDLKDLSALIIGAISLF
ncbi:MAG TPA: hypothetical protein VHR42_01020 [Clostridia bacterium]|nr:hypothetical protein [Clostridia bacterium]